MKVTRADPKQADELTRIASAAKAHWGYPEAWLQRWKDVLTVTPDYISRYPTYAAVEGAKILGFYALQIAAEEAWLDHLWVLPAAMGRGIGRMLFEHAEATARSAGATRLQVEGDPHAEGFYLRMGAKRCGERPAPMDGNPRFLPLFTKAIG